MTIQNISPTFFYSEQSPRDFKNSKGPGPTRVFIVDDAEVVLHIIKEYFRRRKYHVTTARNGFDLIRRVGEVRPNIIVLDVQLPGMDGLQAIRMLRAHNDQTIAATPIIVMTSRSTILEQERYLHAGANGHMNKPLQLNDLEKMINNLLSSSDLRGKL